MAARYLTKSRFKVGYECATKLYYLDNPNYKSAKEDDPFLAALAQGGFQVGELAKIQYPAGVDLSHLSRDAAVIETTRLMQEEGITIFEAAFKFENLLIRVDILEKRREHVKLIEVKSKSFDPTAPERFHSKSTYQSDQPKIDSKWEEYIADVAFQNFVLQKARPDLKIASYLMVADKSVVASVDGLNQRFLISKSGRVVVKDGTNISSIGNSILTRQSVDDEIRQIQSAFYDDGKTFEQFVSFLSDTYEKQIFVVPRTTEHCKKCEWRSDAKTKSEGFSSGFEKCWKDSRGLSDADLLKPMVFEVGNFRSGAAISLGRIFMENLTIEDLETKAERQKREREASGKKSRSKKGPTVGLTPTQRKLLQVERSVAADSTPYFDEDGLRAEMNEWTFPYNFIDFEGTRVAIPFNEGRRAYEQIAFQFSHHIMNADGSVVHKTEYINSEKGQFPNFAFVRNLKAALSENEGTIFVYSHYENTVLNSIMRQLELSSEPDRDELIQFLLSITYNSDQKRESLRHVVDLLKVVKWFYWTLTMGGSNSIKKVLPAVLNESEFLRNKYSKAVYGTSEMPSLNFNETAWLKLDDRGQVIDPYKQLDPVFTDFDLDGIEDLLSDEDEEVANGGAAMMAYARMQFSEMSESEANRIRKALLCYCELDTLAMVMIVEYWRDVIYKAR